MFMTCERFDLCDGNFLWHCQYSIISIKCGFDIDYLKQQTLVEGRHPLILFFRHFYFILGVIRNYNNTTSKTGNYIKPHTIWHEHGITYKILEQDTVGVFLGLFFLWLAWCYSISTFLMSLYRPTNQPQRSLEKNLSETELKVGKGGQLQTGRHPEQHWRTVLSSQCNNFQSIIDSAGVRETEIDSIQYLALSADSKT